MTPNKSSIFSRAIPCGHVVSNLASNFCANGITYLRLRYQEPDEDKHATAEASKGDESSVPATTHGDEHIRHGASDDKIEEPLGCGSERDVERAETCGRDLGDVDPADLHQQLSTRTGRYSDVATYRSPTPLEERREEIDAHKRDVAGRRYGLALLRRADTDEETDVEHGSCHCNGSPEQRLTTTEGVSSEEEKAAAHDHLDYAVDAGGEEAGFRAVQTKVLEDLGRVVVAGKGSVQ